MSAVECSGGDEFGQGGARKAVSSLFNPVCIPDEAYFQPQDRFAFSPLASRTFSVENLVLYLMAKKLSATPDGRQILKEVALKYIDSCARIVESVQDASHTNWLTALNNQHIAAGISHRIGLLDDGSYLKIIEHYRAVFDKMLLLQGVTGTLTALGTFVQGSKTKITRGGAEGIMQSKEGLAILSNLLSLKK